MIWQKWRLFSRPICFAFLASLLPTGICSASPPPVINVQPTNQTVLLNDSVTFSVTANGGGATISYQWRKNGTNLAGATLSSYTISPAQTTDEGVYSVRLTNAGGSITSSNATLTVLSPPSITTPPQSQTVAQGLNATFSVVASGTAPLSYQWSFNGTAITGATNSALVVENARSSDAGNYSVLVMNDWGLTTVPSVTLTVVGPPVGIAGDTICVSATNIALRTWSHTVKSGNNRLLLVGIALADNSATVSSISYAGMLLSRIASTQLGNTVEIWSLVAPPVGSSLVVATWTGNKDMAGWSGNFTNVDQTTPIRSAAVTNGNNSAPTVTLGSAAGDLVVDTLSINGDAGSLSVGSGQTQMCQNTTGNGGGDCWGACSYEQGAAGVTMSWAAGAAKNWGLAAVALKAAVPVQADVAVDLSGPPTVYVNSSCTYTVAVANLGPRSATNLVISNALPAGFSLVSAAQKSTASDSTITWNIPALPSGDTTNFTFVVNVSAVGKFTNIVTATGTTPDPYLANNTSTMATRVIQPPAPTFSTTSGMTADGFNLRLSTVTGFTYVISASTNLVDWTSISTNLAETTTLVVTDLEATNYPQRFYRAAVR